MMYAGKVGRGRNDGTQKARHTKRVLKRLWDYLYFNKPKFVLALFLTVVANALSLVGPYLTGRAIDAMVRPVNFQLVMIYAGLMIGFYIVAAILNYILSITMVRISQRVVYQMRKDVFAKLNRVKISYFDSQLTGDIISKMSYDIDTINTSLATDVMNILTSIVTIVISFVMMLIMSPILCLVFVITIPISILITRTLSKIIKRKYRTRNKKLGELNGYAEEMITGQRTIQSYVQEETVLARFDDINNEASEASYEAGYYGTTVGPSINFVSNLSVALVGVFGGILYAAVLPFTITIGQLTSFTLYSRRFSGPINRMSSIVADIQSALAAAERVFGVLDEPEEVEDLNEANTLSNVSGHIAFENVSFGYDEHMPVLHHVNLEAKPGQIVAIVGPTGAGKTTLVNLIMRFYEINEGKILLDDIDTKLIKRKDLRKAFSMVLQDTWVFHGSIHENIAYGNGDVSRLEVEETAKKAHIHSFITHLSDGYDTILTDEGLNISKGQKQLLVIARAMLSKTKMLILDEATSNVDTHTEIQIQHAMLHLMQGKTTFVIAHRLSTIQHADLILVVKDGNVIEQGKHDALLKKKGYYYTLYQSQFA